MKLKFFVRGPKEHVLLSALKSRVDFCVLDLGISIVLFVFSRYGFLSESINKLGLYIGLTLIYYSPPRPVT
jgi:hypothetical protein